MSLPNPSMSFTPFDILTAEEMNNLVENIESLADGTGFTAGSIPASAMETDANPQTITDATSFDFIESGLVITGDSYGSTRNASITAGVVYINGIRIAVSASVARLYTASRDVYVDVNSSGTLVFTDVTNNAASPALAANSIRIGIVVVGASNIASVASINQGQETKVLPIASSIPYAVTDSLGNLICPRDPQRRVLGYRQAITNQSTSSTTAVQITGVSVPVIVPAGRKVKITGVAGPYNDTNNGGYSFSIWEGTVASGTQLSNFSHEKNTPVAAHAITTVATRTPASSTPTYNFGFLRDGGVGNANTNAIAVSPAALLVELV